MSSFAPSSEPPASAPGKTGLRRVGHFLERAVAGSSTMAMFREDRFLRWAALFASVLVLAPMGMTPFLPLVDMGSNIGAAGLLDDVLRGRPVVSHHYEINWFPVPYWTGYAFMAIVDAIAGPFWAQKTMVGMVVLALPLASMRLMKALGRSPRLGLLVFLLSWDTNLYWGWVSFQLGMAVAVYTLARMVEATKLVQALRLVPLAALIALSHAHAVVLLGLGGVAMAAVRRQPWRALTRSGVVLSGTVLMGLPWLLSRSTSGRARAVGLTFDSPELPIRIEKLFHYTLDNIQGTFGGIATGVAFLLLLFGPAALAGLRARDTGVPRGTAMALAFLLAALIPYLVLPFEFKTPVAHWWNYPRFGTYVLLALMCLPAPQLAGRALWALAPAGVAFVTLQIAISLQFRDYGLYTRPYLEIIGALPRASRFLPLDFEQRAPGFRRGSAGQLHGFAAAATGSYDPHLFDEPNNPLQFRDEHKLPIPNWRQPAATFSMEQQGRHYSHIIVHGLAHDPLVARPDVALVEEAGAWRLYAVTGGAGGAGSSATPP